MRIQNSLLLLASLSIALPTPLIPCSAAQPKHINFSFITRSVYPYRPERVLNFPAFTVGQIHIEANKDATPGPYKDDLQGAAKGKVTVPAGMIVTLIASQRLFQEPQIINTLPPNGIDCLKLNVTSLDDSEDGRCDKALAFVGHLKGLTELNLDRSDATNVGVAHVAELPNLQNLSLFSANCNGSALKQISTLKKLRMFRLSYSAIKDEDLRSIGDLTQLQYLSLGRTGLSDAGMKSIARCSSLEVLDVSKNPKIADEGFKNLMTLKKLRMLNIGGTSITVAGMLKIKPTATLKTLFLPEKAYSDRDMDAIVKAFPNVELCVAGKKHLDSEMDAVLSPLH